MNGSNGLIQAQPEIFYCLPCLPSPAVFWTRSAPALERHGSKPRLWLGWGSPIFRFSTESSKFLVFHPTVARAHYSIEKQVSLPMKGKKISTLRKFQAFGRKAIFEFLSGSTMAQASFQACLVRHFWFLGPFPVCSASLARVFARSRHPICLQFFFEHKF